MLNTQLAAAAGVIGASLAVYLKSRTLDVGMAGNGAIAGLVGDHRSVGLRRVLGGADHRPRRRPDRRLRGAGDRQAPRRPGRRPLRARPGRDLGHPRGRHLRLAAADRRRRRPGHLVRIFGDQSFSSAFGQLGVQALAVVFTFVVVFAISIATFCADQDDDRAAGPGRGGGRRPRHQLARHVRVPGAVHPAAGVLDRVCEHGAAVPRGRLARRRCCQPDDDHRARGRWPA